MNAVVFICIVLALLCRSFGNTDIAPTLSETTAPPSIVIEFANLSSRFHSGINVSAIANHALHYDMVVEVKVSSNELIEFKLYKCRELILGGNIGNKTYILSDSWLVFLFSAGQKPCAFETYDLSLIISSEKNSTGSIEIGTTAKKGFIQHVRNDVNKKIEIDQWFRKIDKRRLSLGPAISTALTNANTTLALITNLTKIPVVRLSKCQSEPITIEIGSKAKTTLSRENMLQIVRLNELICPEDKEKNVLDFSIYCEERIKGDVMFALINVNEISGIPVVFLVIGSLLAIAAVCGFAFCLWQFCHVFWRYKTEIEEERRADEKNRKMIPHPDPIIRRHQMNVYEDIPMAIMDERTIEEQMPIQQSMIQQPETIAQQIIENQNNKDPSAIENVQTPGKREILQKEIRLYFAIIFRMFTENQNVNIHSAARTKKDSEDYDTID